MDRRFFLTIIICFVVAFVYMQVLSSRRPPAVRPGQSGGSSEQPGVQPASPQPAVTASGGAPTAPDGTTPAVVESTLSSGFDNERTVLENPLMTVVAEAHGASITTVELHAYRDDPPAARGRSGDDNSDRAVSLIAPELLGGRGLLLDVEKTERYFADQNWQVLEQSANAVHYRLALPDGRAVQKRITLGEKYRLEVSLEFEGPWPAAPYPPAKYQLLGPERIRFDVGARELNHQVIAYASSDWRLAEVERKDIRKLDQGRWIETQRVLWSGLESNYFAFTLGPLGDKADAEGGRLHTLVVSGSDRELPKEVLAERNEKGIQPFPFSVGYEAYAPAGTVHRYEAFLGPKDREVLADYHEQGYDELVYYGRLGFLVRLFLMLLGWFHSLTGSYGIAIIFLTLIVRTCLHPITKKNQAVMMRQQKKLAKIQPQMQELRERHKSDSLKANREIQKLMRENEVNPAQMMGGCLLMFLQLPIWIGLINTFSLALELRHTPFLYITDLTMPDRLFDLPGGGFWFIESINALPILYVIVTLIAQRMAPRSSDPQMAQQQKMMTFMMVAFGFIFYNFSAGLLLYFLTSSALGIVEQHIIRAELRREGLG